MSKEKCLIIGYGVVGKNIENHYKDIDFDIVDKYKKINSKTQSKYHIGFVCVDTPLINDELDTKEVVNAINENDCDIYVIKSTVPIGFTNSLNNDNIIFSPEFYGDTHHCNNFEFNFTILGGHKERCEKVIQVLQKCFDGRHVFKNMTSIEAEIVKFMENSFLATKVSFCVSFYEMCEAYGASYSEVREGVLLDERIGRSHTFVNEDQRYWSSHCLNKDVASAVSQGNKFMSYVQDFNNKCKSK